MVDLVVKSKIKEAVKDLNVAAEVSEALNQKIEAILQDAAERAKANGRRTLQARDITASTIRKSKVSLIVKSKIKEAVNDLNVAAEVSEALNSGVLSLLQDAGARAKANGRRTLQARDL